jgi:FkbM family methyltransferase
MLMNLAEYRLRCRVLRLLQPGGIMVDVGAHVGFWTIPSALRLGPRGKVIAIEPNPWAVGKLRRNLELNSRGRRLSPVTVLAGAASDIDGFLDLGAWDFVANASQASLHPPAANGKPLQRLTVPVFRLDNVVRGHVDLMKIDVEGHELAVLAGATRLLAQSPPTYLVVEIHGGNLGRAGHTPAKLLAELEHLGYRAFDSDGDFVASSRREPPSACLFDTVAWKHEGHRC